MDLLFKGGMMFMRRKSFILVSFLGVFLSKTYAELDLT
jgi:hypothetical protein